QRLGALVEEGAGARIQLRSGEAAPHRHGGGGEDREHHELNLPGHGNGERDQADQQRGESQPEQEYARRQYFQRRQDETEDQPVPGAERNEHVGHDTTSLYGRMTSAQTRSAFVARENWCPLFRV